ncbi:MAG: MoxR family ATPase [bacterium]
MFASPREVQERFESQSYICSPEVATVVYLSLQLQKPLLVEGPAGVGKTDLAKVLAASQELELIRMQCYEGLDETKALYEWEYAKQLLYTQILKEKIASTLEACRTLSEAVERIASEQSAFFSDRFLVPRPLLKAILSEKPTVLLVDEVDKADPEFEAFLLEVLSEFQVSIPETGTLRARHIPQVVLTSNNCRELGDGLKRRCLYLFIDFPSTEQEAMILRKKVPDLEEKLLRQVADAVHSIRGLDLKKAPSIGETLDWARALLLLHADRLDPSIVRASLPVLIKHPEDQKRVIEKIGSVLPAARNEAP